MVLMRLLDAFYGAVLVGGAPQVTPFAASTPQFALSPFGNLRAKLITEQYTLLQQINHILILKASNADTTKKRAR